MTTRKMLCGVTLLGALAVSCGEAAEAERRPAEPRPFVMGFTPAEYDVTLEAKEITYKFIEDNADLITHHFAEGVPWPEAFEGRSYHPKVEADLAFRVSKRNEKQKVFLYLTPLRIMTDELAGYWGESENMERPGRWKNKDFDDPDVIKAYVNFCRDMIRRLRPDYFAYVIEANGSFKNQPRSWGKFVTFSREVYGALKREHPQLPVMVSLQVEYFWEDREAQQRAIAQILPYTDYIAISTYPYAFGKYPDPRQLPSDYLSALAALAPEKPFAVAETGFIAEDMEAFGLKVPGTEEGQNRYLEWLLAECVRLKARFLDWFVPVDLDDYFRAVEQLNPGPQIVELFKVWRDTGLLDGKGKPRLAFFTWRRWLEASKP